MTSSQPLDIATLPLRGRRLIEASAGTGKTFTLAALYIRLILGHGHSSQAAFMRPLIPAEILVVTFTEAATNELKERIRHRLRDARDVLLGRLDGDEVLHSILASLPIGQETRNALRLDQAMRMMDDAAIFTIHGFCQRMLKRHAFDSGTPFQATLSTDPAVLFDQVVADYWRREYYPLSPAAQQLIQRHWAGPEALQQQLTPLLRSGRPQPLIWGDTCIDPPSSVHEALQPALAKELQQTQALAAAHAAYDAKVPELLQQAADNAQLKKNQFKPEQLTERLSALAQWGQAGGEWPEALTMSNGEPWCSASRLESASKKNTTPPQHLFFDALDAWQQYRQGNQEVPVEALLLTHARDGVAAALAQRKALEGLWDFDDLLNALDDALQGPMGKRLARRIRQELPVALIDEFQDTDAVQYRIFDHLYPTVSPEAEGDSTALLLIGDPKQAIYAFRNADITTYLRARQQIQNRYTLTRNFRSSAAMVDAVNRLFTASTEPFRHPDIPFFPVEAQGLKEVLEIDRHPATALECWWPDMPSSLNSRDYVQLMSSATCHDIAQWLSKSQRGEAGFRQPDGTLRPVCPADIAVLVRKGSEAAQIQTALRKVGIRSVYLSLRRSVFQTRAAFWLLQLLEAVAYPHDDRRIRSIMSTRLMRDDLSEVAQLIDDELGWERLTERFAEFQHAWQQVGILAMVRRVMQAFDISARLLRRPDGERSLTDFMHAVELTQTASQLLEGEQAVLRWLHRALNDRFDSQLDPEALIQRLESDDALVKVITLHKAKGLEYPIVYLPFICDYRAERAKQNSPCPVIDSDEGRRGIAYAAVATLWDAADKARLDEDIRLLYVGLTRARHACRLGTAPLFKGSGSAAEDTTLAQSALGNLLLEDDVRQQMGKAMTRCLSASQTRARLQALAALNSWAVVSLPAPQASLSLPSSPAKTLQPRFFQGTIDRQWWIASYSALVKDSHGEGPLDLDGQTLMVASDREVLTEKTPLPAPPLGPMVNFPRGPQAGSFLHALLQEIDFNAVTKASYRPHLTGMIEKMLLRWGYETAWGPPLLSWISTLSTTVLTTRWPHLTLAQLNQWRTELEFWLPITAGDIPIQRLDDVIRQFEPWIGDYPALQKGQLHGMLRGYIDVVCEHEGRWFIIDWKSNHLGDHGEDYRPEPMGRAMLAHRYDLQYVLYTWALHRHLSVRLPGYEYEHHMGGVLYVFLRGIDAQTALDGQGVIFRRPDHALIERLDRLLTATALTSRAPQEVDHG